jgi:uncharacterized membrane protein (DUF4010 family)
LRVALQFGVLYALILLIVKAAIAHFGNSGLLAVSSLSGLVDLDAITLSLSQMVGGSSLDLVTATRGILLAILANTVVKAAFAFVYGSPALRREVMIVLGVTALSAIACCFFL